MAVNPFAFGPTPRIVFGDGSLASIAEHITRYGRSITLVTGASSFAGSPHFKTLVNNLDKAGIKYCRISVSGEPSPEIIDAAVRECKKSASRAVVAIGGGSVLDAGKAIAAMAMVDGSVTEYMEVVGTKKHPGNKLPFIAVPTTSGTGSEATRNAVISKVGPQGFKYSLRHENFMPDVALVDPRLMLSCPVGITAACGMDALTQLLESFVSTKADPISSALALSGIKSIKENLLAACAHGAGDINVRACMAYAALMSGLALAHAGLGVVHGFAAAIGGLFNVPHGVICGNLLAPCIKITIERLKESSSGNNPFLAKYAAAGAALADSDSFDIYASCTVLLDVLYKWREELKIPNLSRFGVSEKDSAEIIKRTDCKNNPIKLSADDVSRILKESL